MFYLLATGGTFLGATKLIEKIGCNVVGYLTLIQLTGFNYCIDSSKIFSLIQYEKDQQSKICQNLNTVTYKPIVNFNTNNTIVFFHPS